MIILSLLFLCIYLPWTMFAGIFAFIHLAWLMEGGSKDCETGWWTPIIWITWIPLTAWIVSFFI